MSSLLMHVAAATAFALTASSQRVATAAAGACSNRLPPPVMSSPFRIRERAFKWVADNFVSPEDQIEEDDEQAPVVLSDEICLVPGRPVVRVEVAPGNARRIFTGIDVVALGCDVEEMVWATLTDYQNLAKVVPNLVSNTVLSAEAHVGARLQQVGAAVLALTHDVDELVAHTSSEP